MNDDSMARQRAPALPFKGWRPATAGRETNSYFGSAILDGRPTFHLTYRLGIRLAQYLSLAGAAGPGGGLWRDALPAFCILDIAIWFGLRRSERFWLPLRLALDTFDLAFWSLSSVPATTDFGIAVQIGVPLTVEAGFRLGPWAFVVPAVEMAGTEAARSFAHESLSSISFAPLLIGVVMGMSLYAYCRHLYKQSEVERLLLLSANERRAFLAGQNAVAMGANSVVDTIEGLVPILGRPAPGSALWEVADGWKSRLSQSTAREATYLQVALLEWERDHNRHPDLASRVIFNLEEGAGTTLLTGPQVRFLRQHLDVLPLRGHIQVTPVTVGDQPRTPGSALVLKVGSLPLTVPADSDRLLRPLDGSVVGYLLVATFIPLQALSAAADIPWLWAGIGMVFSLGVGYWCHLKLRAQGAAARRTNLHCAVGTALILTTLLTLTMRHALSIDGDTNLITVGLILLALVGGGYCHLGRAFLVEFLAGVLATSALAIVLFPGRSTLRGEILFVDWGFFLFFPVWRHIASSVDRAQTTYASEAELADADAVIEAFDLGQEQVASLVRLAARDAQQQLAEMTPRLPREHIDLAKQRLAHVDHQLATITPQPYDLPAEA